MLYRWALELPGPSPQETTSIVMSLLANVVQGLSRRGAPLLLRFAACAVPTLKTQPLPGSLALGRANSASRQCSATSWVLGRSFL